MQAFADLLDQLVYAQRRTAKLALLADYFRTAPDPDRGWALAALTDGIALKIPLRRVLQTLMSTRIDPVLYQLSRDFVGDTAETVALLWPDTADATRQPPPLAAVVDSLGSASPGEVPGLVGDILSRLDARGRWAFLKLVGGAPRVGVSARLAKTALALAFARDVADIEEVWHALDPPYPALFAWLAGEGPRPDTQNRIVFRPFMLASPVEEADWAGMAPGDFVAEWKWDGIRVQISATPGAGVSVFSRSGDDITPAFPEIAALFSAQHVTLDGELLVARAGVVAPFADLQKRLNRRSVTPRLLREYPAHVRVYDMLFDNDEDVRGACFSERRARLTSWHGSRPHLHQCCSLSELLAFESFEELALLRDGARAREIEGLMLKRKVSPYTGGRQRGHWFKWKRDALTADCVLMYAQRGSGKRSSFYSDLTFGAWRETDGRRELVPVGKAYSGFTDDELRQLDKFIRANTVDSYGPVRAVKPELVLEIAFDAVQESNRRKSGIAMRFPRIHRIRWDKPADEADTLLALRSLI